MSTDALLYRILGGFTIIEVYGDTFFVRGNTLYHKYLAEEYYQKLHDKYSEFHELKTEEELSAWLEAEGFWTFAHEEKMEKYKNDIEDFKVKMFELGFRRIEKEKLRKVINEARSKLEHLFELKHKFDFLTPRGSALMAKNKYLIALSIYNSKNEPVFSPDSFFTSNFPLLDSIIIEYNKKGIDSTLMRAIARSDTWRRYWNARENDNIFGKPATEFTDDQLNLISWTRLYDNVYQHPDCPDEEIINDDDALDGFLIFDKRKRDKDKGLAKADSLITNSKIRNSQEIFMVADTQEDAKRIQELNDASAKATIASRERLIDKKGTVSETDLPDVKRNLKIQINNKASQLAKR